ncbi:MAG: hypothetical protein JW726_05745, partial [Anaerolineales bacterium]|nr:hypothetical protein [Anaerolineales bacterium]
MRPLEIVLLGGLAGVVLFLTMPASQRPRTVHWLPVLNFAVLLLHLLLEGARWQMVPAYLLTVLGLLFAWRNLRYSFHPWLAWQMEDRVLGRTIGAVLSALILVDVLFLTWLAPLFKLPEPGGPYAIGTRFFFSEQTLREETLTPEPGDMRLLSAQVWYPARTTEDTPRQPYMAVSHQVSGVFAGFLSMPFFAFSHLKHIPTHAYRDAPVYSAQFPVLIFSHAYDGNITQNTILMEQLASHGYIVFSIGHPYETPFVFDADANAIVFDPENPGRLARLAEMDDSVAGRIKGQILRAENSDVQRRLFERLMAQTPQLMESVRIWADDIGTLLDRLEDLSGDDPLSGRVNLEQVGVFGHSLGGAASGQFCLVDERCRAGLNMDGFQYGDLIDANLAVPFMFMYSALPDIASSRV